MKKPLLILWFLLFIATAGVATIIVLVLGVILDLQHRSMEAKLLCAMGVPIVSMLFLFYLAFRVARFKAGVARKQAFLLRAFLKREAASAPIIEEFEHNFQGEPGVVPAEVARIDKLSHVHS